MGSCLRSWCPLALLCGILAVLVGIPNARWWGVSGALIPSEAKAATSDTDTRTPVRAETCLRMFGLTPQRNMVDPCEIDVATDWQTEIPFRNIKWTVELGSRAHGSPVVGGGKVFVGTNNQAPRNQRYTDRNGKPLDKGVLMCFDATTGVFLWQAVHDKLSSGVLNDWPLQGVCSTPAVEGDRLYYTSNRCEVVCLSVDGYQAGKTQPTHPGYTDPNDAGVLWRYDMIKELHVYPHNMSACSSLLVGDYLYVVTANGVDESHINVPSPDAPSFICLTKKDGKLVWRDNAPGKNIMHGQWSNPTYGVIKGRPMVIFPGGDGWLRAYEPTKGELLWKFDCNPKGAVFNRGGQGTRSDFIGTPVVYQDKVYIGTGQDPEHLQGAGHLWCIDATGSNDVSAELAVNANVIRPNPNSKAVWHFGGPVKNQADRNRLGKDYYFGRTMSTCAIHNGLLYLSDFSGYFVCLDANTGQLYWDYDMKTYVWTSPLWVDHKVYIGNDDGDMLIFAAGKDKKLLATIENDGQIRGSPTVFDGVLYYTIGTRLYAIEKKK
jgi:outer membrane protein assembly factor BamB